MVSEESRPSDKGEQVNPIFEAPELLFPGAMEFRGNPQIIFLLNNQAN
jgi:hypothetical protein